MPDGGSVLVLGLGPIDEMCTRIAQHRGADQVLAVDLVPERRERVRAHGVIALDLDPEGDDLAGDPNTDVAIAGGPGGSSSAPAAALAQSRPTPGTKRPTRWP